MSRVRKWLDDLGLGQYAALFAENAIDYDILPELDDQDLAGLGIPVGHRKRLLRAVVGLTGGDPAADDPAGSGAPGGGPSTPWQVHAERRPLTVMFCDLVGSTELSARLDPEDLRSVVGAYQDCCAAVVGQLDGYVARYMGDGILVYFGFPRAHEDDASRAIRAGMQIIEAIRKLETETDRTLETRIGIATGLVVVGDLIGVGSSREISAVGQTPNVAARLQQMTKPNTIAIDDKTRQLAQGSFDFADLGEHALKGIPEPLLVWQVTAELQSPGLHPAPRRHGRIPFVNRVQEIELMLDRWESVKEGEGQVILVFGEAGIGKSRLTEAFEGHLSEGTYSYLPLHCSIYHQNTALYPFAEQLRRAIGLTPRESPADILTKIEAHLGSGHGIDRGSVYLLASLLSVEFQQSETLRSYGSNSKEKTLEALSGWIFDLSTERALLMVVEDAHWLDPTSQELLALLIDRVPGLKLFLIITYRSGFEPPFRDHPQVTRLGLNRLRRQQCGAIVHHVTQGKALPEELLAEIIERTAGVPLFLEELTEAILESDGLLDQGNRYSLSSEMPSLSIPTSLHSSLLARLDRFPFAKEVAQIGAIIGHEFSYEMLAAVSSLAPDDLQKALDYLTGSGLLFRSGISSRTLYTFKHGLVQDAAYSSLLHSKRKRLHSRIAKLLEESFTEVANAEPELLSHHYTEAGLPEKAIACRLAAGQQAIARYAMREAISELEMGLKLLPQLPAETDAERIEFALQIALGTALRAARGTSALETGRAWDRARELCNEATDAQLLAKVLYGQFMFHQGNANLEVARRLGEELLELGSRDGDPRILLRGHSAVGRTAFNQGELATAHRSLEQALSLNDQVRRETSEHAEELESRVLDLCYISWTLLMLGFFDQARHCLEQSIATAEKKAESYDLVVARGNACYFHQFSHDRKATQDCADRVIALSTKKGFPHWLSLGVIFRGWVLSDSEQGLETGIEMIQQGLEDHRATGELLEVCYFLGILADALSKAGRTKDAVARVREAMAMIEDNGERWYEAELHRLMGEILQRSSKTGGQQTERHFERAIAVARSQDAKLWELRATLSLCRCRAERGETAGAAALLSPLCAWFSEGPDVAELTDAKALLDGLS